MGTNDGADIHDGPPKMPVQERLSLDVDIDLKVARIMAQTWKDIDAIREGTLTSGESSGSASRAGSQATLPGTAESAVVEPRTAPEPPAAGFVGELEKLANGLHDMVDASTPAADPVEELLRDIRTEHAALAEAITRLRTAVAEVDASSEAFRRAMERYEAAGGEQMVLSETAMPQVSPPDIDPLVAEDPATDSSPSEDRISRRAALDALRSLST